MTCAKVVVTATIITKDGRTFTGRNDCVNPQVLCPRGNLPSGQGYEMCKTICQQPAHAEVVALRKAGVDASGATLLLQGHNFACEDCLQSCERAGIARIVVIQPQDGSAYVVKLPRHVPGNPHVSPQGWEFAG
jgi:deoxycytidylate deaminase